MAQQPTLASMFATDAKKEQEGIVVQYGPIRVRLARAGGSNDRFVKVVEEVTRPYRRMIEHDMLSPDVNKGMSREIFAKAVVLEWSGVADEDGTEIPFTVENAVKVFEKYPEFFQLVTTESQRLANYRAAVLAADAKNSASA